MQKLQKNRGFRAMKFLPFYAISLLPFWALYLVSDVICFLLYRLVRYRVAIVRENLDRAFPEKSTHEKRQIERAFYRHFVDVFMEAMKMLTISKKTMSQQMQLENVDILDEPFRQKKNVIFYCSHHGNWEYLTYLNCLFPHPSATFYKKISSAYMNELMEMIRSRFGMQCVESKFGLRWIAKMKSDHQLVWICINGDQSPNVESHYEWTMMFNQKMATLSGVKRIAELTKAVIIYPHVIKEKRGKYRVVAQEIHPENGDVLQQYAHLLEKAIREAPAHWLWTHRRWKMTN